MPCEDGSYTVNNDALRQTRGRMPNGEIAGSPVQLLFRRISPSKRIPSP